LKPTTAKILSHKATLENDWLDGSLEIKVQKFSENGLER
jgi:hypothetical protein